MPHTPMLPGLLAPLAPNEYIRLRRLAAGLTIPEAAKPYYARPEHAADVERNLTSAEAPGAVLKRDWLIDDYSRAFPFDAAVYRQLRDEPPERHPTVCRGCGCTSWTPCIGRDGEDCTMSDASQCTACEQKADARLAHRRAA